MEGRWLILALIAICLIGYGGYVIKAVLLPVKTVTKQIDSASEIIDKTYDADNAIYNYEWFKTQYEKIEANRQQVGVMKESLSEFKILYGNASTWGYSTRQEYDRLNSVMISLRNQDKNLVAEYNARSKMANREIFKDKLPLYVDVMLW